VESESFNYLSVLLSIALGLAIAKLLKNALDNIRFSEELCGGREWDKERQVKSQGFRRDSANKNGNRVSCSAVNDRFRRQCSRRRASPVLNEPARQIAVEIRWMFQHARTKNSLSKK
jgi:hypothetical protein